MSRRGVQGDAQGPNASCLHPPCKLQHCRLDAIAQNGFFVFLFVFLISKNSLYILLYTSVWEHVDSCNIIYDAYLEFHATSFPWRERTASCHSNPRNMFILQCRVLNNTAILNRRQRPCSYEQDTRYLSRVGEM